MGSNPTGVTLLPRRHSLKAEHRRFSDSQLRRSLLKHIPTAVLEYMAHNPEVAGSIPASVSDQPTAGSDYIYHMKHLNHYLVGRSLIIGPTACWEYMTVLR